MILALRRGAVDIWLAQWTTEEHTRQLADVCASLPRLRELVQGAMPPRGRSFVRWPRAYPFTDAPDLAGSAVVVALRGRCPNLRVLCSTRAFGALAALPRYCGTM